MAGEKAEKLAQLIDLLDPLSDEERLRAVNAALTYLGTTLGPTSVSARKSEEHPLVEFSRESADQNQNLPTRAARWLKQNEITESQLENLFHLGSGDVQIIAADVPAHENREKTRQCYLLVGIRTLLKTGEPLVSDEEARELCRSIGCYDRPNHSTAVKGLRNFVTGSKSTGFELTQPGLRAAAEMVKTMAGA